MKCISTLLLKPCHKKQESYNEKLAANFVVGAESISALVSFLADMDGADMESAPTVVVDVRIVFFPSFPGSAWECMPHKALPYSYTSGRAVTKPFIFRSLLYRRSHKELSVDSLCLIHPTN